MNKIVTLLVLGIAIFILSGGLDVTNIALNGYEDKALIMSSRFRPKVSGLSPVAMMLSTFGFMGIYLITKSTENKNINKKLAAKQELAGVIMLMTIAFLLELTYRLAMV